MFNNQRDVLRIKPILIGWSEHELSRFLIVGGTTVFIDLICYLILVYSNTDTDISKGISFSIGTIFAYFANRKFTFRSSDSGLLIFVIFCLLYLSTLIVNVVTNEMALDMLGRVEMAFMLAFILATALSAILNFFGMKYLVFRKVKR